MKSSQDIVRCSIKAVLQSRYADNFGALKRKIHSSKYHRHPQTTERGKRGCPPNHTGPRPTHSTMEDTTKSWRGPHTISSMSTQATKNRPYDDARLCRAFANVFVRRTRSSAPPITADNQRKNVKWVHSLGGTRWRVCYLYVTLP